MSLVSPVFQQHYKDYLTRVAGLDLDALAPELGGRTVRSNGGREIEIPFFNRPCRVSSAGVKDHDGRKPGYDTCIILCRYLIMAGDRRADRAGLESVSDQWAGFRDLKDSGPLFVYFRDNVEQAILGALAGRMGEAEALADRLGGVRPDMDIHYDLCMMVRALPRVPVLILANEAEDGFPPSCSVLFRPEAERYIDAECIAMAGHRLAAIIRKTFS